MAFEDDADSSRYIIRRYTAHRQSFSVSESAITGRGEALQAARYMSAHCMGLCVLDANGTEIATFGTIPKGF